MKAEGNPPKLHPSGQGTNLWIVVSAPTVWAIHFLVVYPAVAVYCAKAGRGAELDPMRWVVIAASALALLILAGLFLRSWRIRQPSVTQHDLTFEANSPEERHRFLTHLSLALCALSIVGVLYVTIPVLLVETCR